jgi:hypothetical protein
VLPENRDYRYHHFRDNCATRIRDIIDTGTGGAFKTRYEREPGRFTLRQHVRRHTWFSPFWDWILNFWMGQGIDRPITVWEEMFLPAEIGTRIGEFTYTDDSGTRRALVSSVEVVNRASGRRAVLDRPRSQWGKFALGLVLAAAALFMAARKRNRLARLVLGVYQALLGLFFGTAGFLLFFMMFCTDHDYTYHNSNSAFVHPLALAAVPLGLFFAFTRNERKRSACAFLLQILWTAVFAGGILSWAVKLLPGFYQQNQPTLMLVLPFACALSVVPGRLRRFVSRRLTCSRFF